MGHSCLSKINIFKFSNPFYSVKPECAIRHFLYHDYK